MQKKIYFGFILTLFIVIFVPVYWATEPGRQASALKHQQTETRERGAEVYSSQCAVCHGSNGTGGIGPALKGTQLDARTMVKITGRGIAGTAMPPWSNEEGGTLAKYQVEDVVNFVLNWDDSLLPGSEAGHASPPASAPAPA
ncbi:MAG: cytochrome c, partial [Dehalococcoidia bacterium]|nr:cytochrome c [Dehalococcoidia bacterium]